MFHHLHILMVNYGIKNQNPFFNFQYEPGIDEYYYVLDQQLNTIPNQNNSTYLATSNLIIPGLDPGSYWLHVVGIDDIGNVGNQPNHLELTH